MEALSIDLTERRVASAAGTHCCSPPRIAKICRRLLQSVSTPWRMYYANYSAAGAVAGSVPNGSSISWFWFGWENQQMKYKAKHVK